MKPREARLRHILSLLAEAPEAVDGTRHRLLRPARPDFPGMGPLGVWEADDHAGWASGDGGGMSEDPTLQERPCPDCGDPKCPVWVRIVEAIEAWAQATDQADDA
jgi:hypothetical protein